MENFVEVTEKENHSIGVANGTNGTTTGKAMSNQCLRPTEKAPPPGDS